MRNLDENRWCDAFGIGVGNWVAFFYKCLNPFGIHETMPQGITHL